MLNKIAILLLMTMTSTIVPMVMSDSVARQQEKPQQALICDLGGVVLGLKTWSLMGESYLSHIGIANVAGYVLGTWKSPKNLQHVIFDVLNHVDLQEPAGVRRTRTTSGVELPYILCAYQAGKITSVQARSLALAAVDVCKTLQRDGYEEAIVRKAIDAMFTPDIQCRLTCELTPGFEAIKHLLAQKDDQGNEKFIPFAFSNWDKESIVKAIRRFPHIFNLFKVVFISGEIGAIKPNRAAFGHVLDRISKEYRIDSKNCYFIDDQAENCDAAVECGLDRRKVIQYTAPDALLRDIAASELLEPALITAADRHRNTVQVVVKEPDIDREAQ